MGFPPNRLGSALLISIASVLAPAEASLAHADGFTFRVETSGLELLAAEDGTFRIAAAGFRTRPEMPGAPDIPWRTVLVAIPPGAEPTIEVVGLGPVDRRPGVKPRPVPRIASIHSGEAPTEMRPGPSGDRTIRKVFEADPLYYDPAGEPAEVSPARLGEIGVLRGQRYVAVHVSPIRYDPATGELLTLSWVDVRVRFGSEAVDSAAAPVEPLLESVYRKTFLNYEQGRHFRLAAVRPDESGSPAAVSVGAGSPLRRIVIRENGIVRLDHALFLAEAPEFLTLDPADWRLTSRGVDVPLHLHQGGGEPNVLEAGEWVQFYGQALDDEPQQILNTDTGGLDDLYEARDFSDDNVYFLTVSQSAQPTMPTRDAAPGLATPPQHFPATAHAETNDVFFPLAGDDLFYWLPLVSESSPIRTDAIALPRLADGALPARVRVALRGVSECDGFDPDHETRIRLSNDSLETLALPLGNPDNVGDENLGQFDGQALFVHDFDWVHGGTDPLLSDPLTVVLEVDDLNFACPTGGVVKNDVVVNWIEIDYRRDFASSGDTLVFDYPDSDADFEVTGLLSPDPEIHVYEVTGRVGQSGIAESVRLTGVVVAPDNLTYAARFRMDDDPAIADGTLRRFVVAGPGAIAVPPAADFRADRVSRLKSDTTQADLVVVAHPDLLDSRCSVGSNPCSYDVECASGPADRCELDPSSVLSQLLAHRASQGISSRVARVQDVEDDFQDGLAGPTAIKKLIAWTQSGGWSGAPPSFVLLLGDGSYDYKSGTANGNFVSTQLMIKKSAILAFYASDNVMAAVVGADQIPDVTVGRISARSLAEAEIALQKVLDYEQNAPAGGWRGNALFISDRANDFGEFEAGEFERINQIGVDLLADTAYSTQNLRYWSDECVPSVWTCTVGGNVCVDDGDCAGGGDLCRPNCDKVGMRVAIKDAVNGISGPGAAIVQYTGHGNFDLWSEDVLFCANEQHPACSEDGTLDLTNDLKLPWLLVHNCLTGGFHSLNEKSFGEQWQKHAAGGAAAVFAPSGLGFRFLGEGVSQSIWDDVFGPRKERQIAVPVMNSLAQLCAQSSIEGCQFYTLLGDPSMRLALPDVGPADDLVAVGDNGVVNLSWTGSATSGATYDIWRTKQLLPPFTLPYEKINLAPIVASSYADTAVVNTQDYFYYVVAVDPDGFESRWSNFNGDCDVVGPDCVLATPQNLTAPVVPENLTAEDEESGGRLGVRWNANPEQDIDFYSVHYGTTPALGQTMDVDDNRLSLSGLTDGVEYFVAVTATNTTGVTSGLSNTATATPSLLLGVRSPDFIRDLIVQRSGQDALLVWGAVTTDIYGRPEAVQSYEAFRGESPPFLPALPNRVGITTGLSVVDPLALEPEKPDYFYLVRAIDVDGNPGGLGNQLPAGTAGLTIADSVENAGHIILSWPEVATDFDGTPINIDHYEVYGSGTPFGRAEIESGAVGPPVASVSGTSAEFAPLAPSRFYSVLAIDARGNRSPF